MAAGDPSAAATCDAPATVSSTASYPDRLREALAALSQVTSILTEATTTTRRRPGTVRSCCARCTSSSVTCHRTRAARFLLEVMAIDALSLVLPVPVAKLGAQTVCWDIASAILKFFVTNCSPRDLLSILCEALDTPMSYQISHPASFFYSMHLLKRRHIEQVKVVLPAILKVMSATVSECDEEHGKAAVDLFNAAHGIGNAIQEMCKEMVNKNKEDHCAILGLYSLQSIALVSRSRQQDILSACGSVVLQHFRFQLKFGHRGTHAVTAGKKRKGRAVRYEGRLPASVICVDQIKVH